MAMHGHMNGLTNNTTHLMMYTHPANTQASCRNMANLGIEGNMLFPSRIPVDMSSSGERRIMGNKTFYSWFIPGERDGRWSTLKTVQLRGDTPCLLWTRDETNPMRHSHPSPASGIRRLAQNKVPVYYAPMSSLVYSYTPGDGDNFELYLYHSSEGTYSHITYLTNPGVSYAELFERPMSQGELGKLKGLYRVSTNEEVSVRPWSPSHCDDGGWDTVGPMDEESYEVDTIRPWVTQSPLTPRMPPETDLDEDWTTPSGNDWATGDWVDPGGEWADPENSWTTDTETQTETQTQTETMRAYPDSESDYDTDVETVVEGIPVSAPESDEESTITLSDDSESEYDSDEVSDYSDSSDESIDDRYRMDDTDNQWYTKDEFYDYYGTDSVWEAMHPINHIHRQCIYGIYHYYGQTLSYKKLKLFIKEITDTY
jgi:hypothetical protein